MSTGRRSRAKIEASEHNKKHDAGSRRRMAAGTNGIKLNFPKAYCPGEFFGKTEFEKAAIATLPVSILREIEETGTWNPYDPTRRQRETDCNQVTITIPQLAFVFTREREATGPHNNLNADELMWNNRIVVWPFVLSTSPDRLTMRGTPGIVRNYWDTSDGKGYSGAPIGFRFVRRNARQRAYDIRASASRGTCVSAARS